MKSWRELGIDIDDLEEVARPWVLREKGPLNEGQRGKNTGAWQAYRRLWRLVAYSVRKGQSYNRWAGKDKLTK